MKLRKYVIINHISPVPFDGPLQHKDMRVLGNVTSAGYFTRQEGRIVIAGEAVSITVKPGEHDAAILEHFLNLE